METKQLETKRLETCIKARIPVLLWGPPGVGKTAVVEQVAAGLGAGFVPLAVSTRPPEDFSGLPVPRSEGGVSQEPMSWIVRALREAEKNQEGCIVLLDEFSCCPPATQAALLSLVQSRYCGDTHIPQSVAFVAAGNPVDQAADGWELPAPTISRWVHLDWPCPTVEEWTEWLTSQSVRPEDEGSPWAGSAGAHVRGLVAGFLSRSRSSLMGSPTPSDNGRARPYPCPRSWENAARLMSMSAESNEVQEDLVRGAIGHGAATEFLSWVRESDLPDPEELLRDPSSWSVPKGRADRALATLLGAVGALDANPTQDRYSSATDLIISAVDAGMTGVAVVAANQMFNLPSTKPLEVPRQVGRVWAVARSAKDLGLTGNARKGAA